MKKLLLSLGAVAAVVAPVAAVVACGAAKTAPKAIATTKNKNEDPKPVVSPTKAPDPKISETLSPNKKIKVPVTKKHSVRTNEIDASTLGDAIADLNTKLALAVKQTVEDALKANPDAGKYTEVGGMNLDAKNAKDWNIEIKVVTDGFFNADNTYYTSVSRDGYVNPMVKPMLSYNDASSGLPIAVELTRTGIDKFFKLYAHGGLSLSLKGPATTENTGFKASMKLVNEFFSDYGKYL